VEIWVFTNVLATLRCALLDTSVCSGWRSEKLLDFALGVRWLCGVCAAWSLRRGLGVCSAFCIVLLFLLLLLFCCRVVCVVVLVAVLLLYHVQHFCYFQWRLL